MSLLADSYCLSATSSSSQGPILVPRCATLESAAGIKVSLIFRRLMTKAGQGTPDRAEHDESLVSSWIQQASPTDSTISFNKDTHPSAVWDLPSTCRDTVPICAASDINPGNPSMSGHPSPLTHVPCISFDSLPLSRASTPPTAMEDGSTIHCAPHKHNTMISTALNEKLPATDTGTNSSYITHHPSEHTCATDPITTEMLSFDLTSMVAPTHDLQPLESDTRKCKKKQMRTVSRDSNQARGCSKANTAQSGCELASDIKTNDPQDENEIGNDSDDDGHAARLLRRSQRRRVAPARFRQ
ncbi:hypothetical protein CFIMG_007278RA00001 [Ceratocystis fimbriata CBS 114723]|uniref:Uncharacterized protein n=1 Tax=Ceratocystis fimbriata CBS 114723 TaxID=1035309 RepID=A0A2C5WY43_9PEZI|nr:hypothetical protein CFIMG_007278RA00001 [Ceratocystis fimbriata CBS 114723]